MLNNYLSFLQEVNYVISGGNKYYNINKFKNDKDGKLFIVGLSGSGKTSLGKNIAKKYNAEYFKLDDINNDFIKEFKKNKNGKLPISQLGKFFEKIMSLTGKYVVEGVDILYYEPKFFKDKAVIILGTSLLLSSIRAYNRNFEKFHDQASRVKIVHDLYINQKSFLRRLKQFEKFMEGE